MVGCLISRRRICPFWGIVPGASDSFFGRICQLKRSHDQGKRPMMDEPLGISPTNDFAYKKVFGSQANSLALISLLNAILNLPRRIASVTIQNPFNYQDFYEDNCRCLILRRSMRREPSTMSRCRLTRILGDSKTCILRLRALRGQLRSGDSYTDLKPVFAILFTRRSNSARFASSSSRFLFSRSRLRSRSE